MNKWLNMCCAIMLFTSCEKHQWNDCISGAGDRVVHVRDLDAFEAITVSDRFHVKLVRDTSFSVAVEGGENLMPGIKTEVKDQTLFIKDDNTCNFVRSYDQNLVVEVHIDTLKELNLFADVSLECLDTMIGDALDVYSEALNRIDLKLNYRKFSLETTNSCIVSIVGEARTFKGQIADISELDALNFKCREVLVDFHTPLNCTINGTHTIFVNLTNSGDVFYKQEPIKNLILNSRTGTGDLKLWEP